MKRLDTKLESEGAEFLVLGQLLFGEGFTSSIEVVASVFIDVLVAVSEIHVKPLKMMSEETKSRENFVYHRGD